MTSWDDLEQVMLDDRSDAKALLAASETVLETWIEAKGEQPTGESREGFRLLALHFQGAKGDPSFNACRETCREICWHYNLLTAAGDQATAKVRSMMGFVSHHLLLFIRGKMEVAGLGEFCCSSKPIRSNEQISELMR
jgi:hypothetical protein